MLRRGFTILETAITAFILTAGLVAAAWMFAFSAKTNVNNHQRTIGLLLLREKMEQFKVAVLNDALWSPGGSLDAASPTNGYFDNVQLGGAIPYLRLWRVDGASRRTLTVVVYMRRAGRPNVFMELGRATTTVSP